MWLLVGLVIFVSLKDVYWGSVWGRCFSLSLFFETFLHLFAYVGVVFARSVSNFASERN